MELSVTPIQLLTLQLIIKTSIEHDECDQFAPDFESVEAMQFNLDRAELLQHISEHLAPCVSEVAS